MQPLARYLDAAALKPEMTTQEVLEAIRVSVAYECKTICVRPCDIDLAVKYCAGTNTGVSCVLAFPHGTASARAKLLEAEDSARAGVTEIDMVANYGFLRSGRDAEVEQEIRAIAALCHARSIGLKVILETALLTPEEIRRGVNLAVAARADFVKTSTGFASGGASEAAVALMLETSQGRIAVKASGGIRDAATAQRYVDMGCGRLGVNAASVPALCGGGKAEGTGY